MKICSSILLLVGLCCLNVIAQTQIEGISNFKPVNITSDNEVDYYAVVVGIDKYNHLKNLSYSAGSATRFKSHLTAVDGMKVPSRQVKLLTNNQANKNDIVNALQVQFEKADYNDVVIFYFSGHGFSGEIAPKDYSESKAFSSVSYDDVYKVFNTCKAKHKLWLLDACRNEITMSADSEFKSLRDDSSGLAVLFSTSDGTKAKQTQGLELSVYTHFLIEGLEGNADIDKNNIIDLEELSKYIINNTNDYTAGNQQPELYLPDNKSIKNMPLIILE